MTFASQVCASAMWEIRTYDTDVASSACILLVIDGIAK
jgi:hypothetical protein